MVWLDVDYEGEEYRIHISGFFAGSSGNDSEPPTEPAARIEVEDAQGNIRPELAAEFEVLFWDDIVREWRYGIH